MRVGLGQLSLALLLCLWGHSAHAIKISIPPGQTECLSETITEEHFQVPGGARVDGRLIISGKSPYYAPFINARLVAPDGKEVWQGRRLHAESHFNGKAPGPGTYKICLSNPKDSRTEAVIDLVYFTLAHLRRSGPASLNVPKGNENTRSAEVAQKVHTDTISTTVESLSEFMDVISGSQRYLQRRRERHKKTMISNQQRTTFYSLLEMLTLVIVAAVQVITIVSFFKTGKVKISV